MELQRRGVRGRRRPPPAGVEIGWGTRRGRVEMRRRVGGGDATGVDEDRAWASTHDSGAKLRRRGHCGGRQRGSGGSRTGRTTGRSCTHHIAARARWSYSHRRAARARWGGGCGGKRNHGAEAMDATSRALGGFAFVGDDPGLLKMGFWFGYPLESVFHLF